MFWMPFVTGVRFNSSQNRKYVGTLDYTDAWDYERVSSFVYEGWGCRVIWGQPGFQGVYAGVKLEQGA